MKKRTVASLKEEAAGMSPEAAQAWLLSLVPEYGNPAAVLADKYGKVLAKQQAELERLIGMTYMEKQLRGEGFRFIGGIDEAGRGPLAGPVVAACVILPEDCFLEKLNDSKKLSAAVRDRLFDEIRQKAIAWGVGICDAVYIDRVNILNATKKAMLLAVQALKVQPDALIIDALKLDLPLRQIGVPKADENSLNVAAASVLAKVTRDRLMEKMDVQYPMYGFAKHKGYGTPDHIEALFAHGQCPEHRRSFTHGILSGE